MSFSRAETPRNFDETTFRKSHSFRGSMVLTEPHFICLL